MTLLKSGQQTHAIHLYRFTAKTHTRRNPGRLTAVLTDKHEAKQEAEDGNDFSVDYLHCLCFWSWCFHGRSGFSSKTRKTNTGENRTVIYLRYDTKKYCPFINNQQTPIVRVNQKTTRLKLFGKYERHCVFALLYTGRITGAKIL